MTTHNKRKARPFTVLSVVLLWAACAYAADTQYDLQYGGTVTVDPDTNRATVTRGGVTTPLWDGTHRLEDGSTLIIRQGTSVPREDMHAPGSKPEPEIAEAWKGAPITGYSPCEKLVRRACGKANECAGREGCNLARQLLDMESGERAASDDRNRMTYTSGQCRGVEQDLALFPYCR